MRNRFTNLGWAVTVVVAVLPIAIWLVFGQSDWSTNKLIVENMGKMAGLAGLSLFVWDVILSARLKIFGRLFMGLDNMYRAHHIIGCIALILLLVHPMLLTSRYLLSSPISAYEFLKPSFEAPYRFLGSVTLASFAAIMLATLYLHLRYERLVLLMRLLGVLVFLGGLHAILVGGSDISNIPLLQAYILGMLGLAAIVYVYRSLFHGSFAKKYQYKVVKNTQRGEISEIWLMSEGEGIKHLPGQFAFIKIHTNGVPLESHSFTISSGGSEAGLRFSIKRLGDFTNALTKVKVGDAVEVDGPYGSFSNQVVTSQRQVWVAGGIGITPFLSMANDLGDSQQRVDLYYSLQNESQAVYLPELQALAKRHANLRLLPFYSDKDGFLTADYIDAQSKNLDANTAYMVCGPPPMMKALRAQLRSRGVANKNIHTEEFSLL